MSLRRWPTKVVPVAWLLAMALLRPAHVSGQQEPEAARPPDPGLVALIESAKDAVLVHVLDDSCATAGTGAGPAMDCEGLVLMRWKGLTDSGPVSFSLSRDVVRLGGGGGAADAGRPLPLLHRGGRYVLSLRYAQKWEKRPFALRPFTADEADAALELTDTSQLVPVFALPPLADKLHPLPDVVALGDLEGIAHSHSMQRRHAEQQTEDEYCCALSPKRLQETGPRLPSYLPSLFDQSRYQAMLADHQELRFAWDSLARDGGSGTNGAPDAAKGPDLSFLYLPELKVVERRHALPDSPGRIDAVGRGQQYVFVAVTANGEVRGLDVPAFSVVRCPDPPRLPDSGPAGPGNCSPLPTGRFSVRLPDDPEIRKIVILKVRIDRNGYYFRAVGNVDLKDAAR